MEYGEADLCKLLKEQQQQQQQPSQQQGSKDSSNSRQAPDETFIRYILHEMLLSVRTVHAFKIVHCDLKPANFLMVRGRLKLIDFGISKCIQNDTTNIVRENQVGTVNYMSPEALKESSTVPTAAALGWGELGGAGRQPGPDQDRPCL